MKYSDISEIWINVIYFILLLHARKFFLAATAYHDFCTMLFSSFIVKATNNSNST